MADASIKYAKFRLLFAFFLCQPVKKRAPSKRRCEWGSCVVLSRRIPCSLLVAPSTMVGCVYLTQSKSKLSGSLSRPFGYCSSYRPVAKVLVKWPATAPKSRQHAHRPEPSIIRKTLGDESRTERWSWYGHQQWATLLNKDK